MNEGTAQGGPSADWYPDPNGKHEYRYWDGTAWTGHVSDAGQVSQDAVGGAAPEEHHGEIREAIIGGLGAWGESLLPAMKAQNPVENTDTFVEQTVAELTTAFGAVLIMLSESSPEFGTAPGWAAAAVNTVFETVTEDKLTENMVSNIAGSRDSYRRNLAASPEVVQMASKYGQSAYAIAGGLADDFVEQSSEAVRSIAPLVWRMAGEPQSRAALEAQLTGAVAGRP